MFQSFTGLEPMIENVGCSAVTGAIVKFVDIRGKSNTQQWPGRL